MGRPPKIPKKNKLIQYILDSFLYENKYEPVTKAPETEFYFCSPNNLVGINNDKEMDFMGVIRELDGDKYIKNYFRDNSYCMFDDDSENLVDLGDMIVGKYEEGDLFGKIISFKKQEFKVADYKGEAFIKKIETNK